MLSVSFPTYAQTTSDQTSNITSYFLQEYNEVVHNVESYGTVYAVSLVSIGLMTFLIRR